MNTIPSTFSERRVSHTVIGGTTRQADEPESPLTVILLNRGGRFYRSAVFQNLENAGIGSVISVETSKKPYDLENLSARFPSVRFLVPLEPVSVGELINTAMFEAQSPRVFVCWNDLRLPQAGIPQRAIDRLEEEPSLCVVPSLTGQRLETVPVHMVPAFAKRTLTIEPLPGVRDQAPTIYPFDYVGLYDRERFLSLGGFDPEIANPYWQNLDFGFRAFLWGERILVSNTLRLSYEGDIPREDITPDSSYVTFFLKNIAPIRKKGIVRLPARSFIALMLKGGLNLFDAIGRYRRVAGWLSVNRNRFVSDAASLVSSWELP